VKILDLCDPDWLDGRPVRECIELCDAVTCSSEELVKFVKQMTDKPVVYIPDRISPKAVQGKKEHKGKARAVVWFGYHTNQEVLETTLMTIDRLGLDLTVISDMPYSPSGGVSGINREWGKQHVKNVTFDPETYVEEIIRGGDMVLNPQPSYGRFKYKSQNKTWIAWTVGMPVVFDSGDMERFMDEKVRIEESEKKREWIMENQTTDKSVKEYTELIEGILQKKATV
jgi:hypothetical protein